MIPAKLAEYAYELNSLIRCYPQFVVGSNASLVPGDVPVFVFHTIEPDRFESQLAYLAQGGFRWIGLEEFLGITSGRLRGTGKEVLLTIDDARSSVWRYGYPLLRKYEAKAVVFAITGWTPQSAVRPTLDELGGTQPGRKALHDLDPDDATVCSWEELQRMRASGLVDVESHSHLHRRVFVHRRLTGVVTAASIRTPSDAVFSPYLSPAMDPTTLSPDAYLGYPLFATAPLLGAPRMIEVATEAALAVSAEFRKQGSALSAAGLQALSRLLPESAFRSVDVDEVAAMIREDLAASQRTLRAGLGDPATGRHLCLPYTAGSDAAIGAARELGYSSIFWGVDPRRRSNPPGSDPLRVVRLKNDFIWRLPGTGRRSLAGIYLEKTSRRLADIAPH